jgi:putative transposase
MDFLADGRRFRALTVVDNLSIGEFRHRGGAVLSPSDKGTEFISRALAASAGRLGVRLDFSRPGKATDNPFIESFNGLARGFAWANIGSRLWRSGKATIEAWRVDYGSVRPHRTLGQLTPAAPLAALEPPGRAVLNPTGASGFASGHRYDEPVNDFILRTQKARDPEERT